RKEDEGGSDQMFPGGNTTIARLMLKSLLPAAINGAATVEGVSRGTVNFAALEVAENQSRVRLSSTVVSVKHDGEASKAKSISVIYEKGGKLYQLRARSAVMAGGSWTTQHIVRDLPASHRQAYGHF